VNSDSNETEGRPNPPSDPPPSDARDAIRERQSNSNKNGCLFGLATVVIIGLAFWGCTHFLGAKSDDDKARSDCEAAVILRTGAPIDTPMTKGAITHSGPTYKVSGSLSYGAKFHTFTCTEVRGSDGSFSTQSVAGL
jgi:hypothetical protein